MKQFRNFFYLFLLVFLTACDGDSFGGREDEVSTDLTPIITVDVSIDNNAINAATPATITATVKLDGAAQSDLVVTFASELGVFDSETPTALTDANGAATITLLAGTIQGASTVTASIDSGESGSIGFETAGDGVADENDPNPQGPDITVTLALVQPKTTTEISLIDVTNPGQLVATVEGINSPVIVTFTTDIGSIPITSAITDNNNQAFVDIYAGNSLGAGTVSAVLKGGEKGEKIIVVGATTLKMGSGEPFVEDVAEVSLDTLSAGGTAVVSVKIIDENNQPYTLPVQVEFTSNCVVADSASLSSPISSSGGMATSTYLAQGCVGDDPITVSANAGGVNLTANTTIKVLPADAGSIEFVSASPENISIEGIGGIEVSTVIFRVLNINGNPVSNTDVEFELNTTTGGIELDQYVATSDINGIVRTVVNSGTVQTPVRVTASIIGTSPLISSQSSVLVISTGIPDQDSFSISASRVNIENIEGNTVQITARLGDAFNNPVPDGTAVSFTSEAGIVEPLCTTVNGECSVTFTNTDHVPTGKTLDGINTFPEVSNSLGQIYGGRITILATAIGEESFADSNGSGRFDASEMNNFLTGKDATDADWDLPEAFVDDNEDGVFDINAVGGANEEPRDFNSDGAYGPKDNLYNGVLCSQPAHAGCATDDAISVYVRDSVVIVISPSNAMITANGTVDAHETINNPNDSVVNITGENVGGASVIIANSYNQPMPEGTLIEFTATAGSIVGKDSFIWGDDNHNGGQAFTVSIEGQDEPKSGVLIVDVTTPNGITSSYRGISIEITPPAAVAP